MKRIFIPVLAMGMLAFQPQEIFAQDKQERTQEETSADNEKFGEYDEIIIKRKGDKDSDAKVIVEIREGEVIVNGEPIEKFEDEEISVLRRKPRMITIHRNVSPFRNFEGMQEFRGPGNRAILGVSTSQGEGGARVEQVSEGSAAEKAGLKSGDLITKVDDIKIENPADLSKAVGKYKPEEKVTVTFKRDGKENKVTVTLGKREGSFKVSPPDVNVFPRMENFDFNFDMDGFPGMGGRQRLGLKAQDTENGKGVKVIDVDDESVASKAGIKEDDIIVEFDGKTVNSADELVRASRGAMDKSSFKIKLDRDGKSRTVEVKIPKKLKTATL